MCYRVSIPDHENLSSLFSNLELEIDLPDLSNYNRYYHVLGQTHPMIPIMTMEEPHKVQPHMWGLVQKSSKTNTMGEAMIQAKRGLNLTCEKVGSYYKYLFEGGKRCLIFVDGLYEFHHENTKETTPYHIYMPDHKPFALGGLYNSWYDKESDSYLETVGMFTTPPNERMRWIHNNPKAPNGPRMPFIVDYDNWGTWFGEAQEAQALMKPYPEGVLLDHIISKNITKKGFDANIPEIQQPVEELPPTTLF